MKQYFHLISEEYLKKNEASADVASFGVQRFVGQHGLKRKTFSIKSDELSKKLSQPKGNYVVVSFEDIFFASNRMINYLINHLSGVIKKFIKNALHENGKILIVGLGNKSVSADSLGYNTLKYTMVSENFKHISKIKKSAKTFAIATSVYGKTGVESSEIIESVVKKIKPDAILLVDTLCAENWFRLGTSFQVNNAGIVPGSGVGNFRSAINSKLFGVTVVSVGVPLVMYADSFVFNAMETVRVSDSAKEEVVAQTKHLFEGVDALQQTLLKAASSIKGKASGERAKEIKQLLQTKNQDYRNEEQILRGGISEFANNLIDVLEEDLRLQLLTKDFNNMLVTLDDIDTSVNLCGKIVAFAINKAITGLSVQEQKDLLFNV